MSSPYSKEPTHSASTQESPPRMNPTFIKKPSSELELFSSLTKEEQEKMARYICLSLAGIIIIKVCLKIFIDWGVSKLYCIYCKRK